MDTDNWPPLRLTSEKVTLMRKTATSTIVLAALLATGCVSVPRSSHAQTKPQQQSQPAMSAAPEVPEQFLGKLYKRYAPNGPGLSDAARNPQLLPRVYDESLLQLMKTNKAYASGDLLDYDLICDCQDPGVSDLKVITGKEANGHVSATAIFNNYKDPKQVTFDLIRSGPALKIYNIKTKTVDLRATLTPH